MPAMSADDRARRAADLAPMITTTPVYAEISRMVRAASKQTTSTTIATNVPMRIYPAAGDGVPPELRTIPVGSGRVDAYAFAERATDVQMGDQITTPSGRYKVIGLAGWLASVGLALSELVTR